MGQIMKNIQKQGPLARLWHVLGRQNLSTAGFMCLSLLLLTATGATNVVEAAVAAKSDSKAVVLPEGDLKEVDWSFTPFAKDRRDPFYNLEEIAKAERDLKILIEKQRLEREGSSDLIDESPKGPVIAEDAHEIDIALAKAREQGNKAEQSLLEFDWKAAMHAAQKGLEILATVSDLSDHPRHKKVLDLQELLNGYHKNAKEAEENQIAEERFNALNLQVQGIMWSADKKSLAIISGRHVYVQDTIGEGDDIVTIVNIDPNRVDFMINYNRRRFEFKRFIGE